MDYARAFFSDQDSLVSGALVLAGELTRQEVQRLQEAFLVLLRQGDGALSPAVLLPLLQRLLPSVPQVTAFFVDVPVPVCLWIRRPKVPPACKGAEKSLSTLSLLKNKNLGEKMARTHA